MFCAHAISDEDDNGTVENQSEKASDAPVTDDKTTITGKDEWWYRLNVLQKRPTVRNKKLSYRKGTARRTVSVEILSTAAQLNDLKRLAVGEWT